MITKRPARIGDILERVTVGPYTIEAQVCAGIDPPTSGADCDMVASLPDVAVRFCWMGGSEAAYSGAIVGDCALNGGHLRRAVGGRSYMTDEAGTVVARCKGGTLAEAASAAHEVITAAVESLRSTKAAHDAMIAARQAAIDASLATVQVTEATIGGAQ